MGVTTGLTASKAWRLRVQEKAIKYYLQGQTTLKEVAARITEEESRGISFKSVHNYIRAAIAQWEKENNEIIADYKHRELKRIDLLEQTAWAAFERSCLPTRTVVKKQTPIAQEPGKRQKKSQPLVIVNEEIVTMRENAGDKKFLDTVQWCVDKRLEVLASLSQPNAEADKPGNITNNTTIRQIIFKGRTSTGTAQVTITNE